ncbi:MAG: cobalamin-dependent protein [Actinobacteria bacterium]|jgi:methanogenic corrinoid protein MtbC1|nr:cobalamin-dependent protein [Actinomycetota bacterium]
MIADRVTTPADPPAEIAPAVARFLELIEHGRPEAAVELVLERVHDGETVTETVQRLLAPAQRQVGAYWQLGSYTVTQEHVVSGVVDDLLGLLSVHTAQPTAEHTVALVCAEGEWHTTPARMAALCLRDAGLRVQFLGGSLPPEHLGASLRQLAPRAVAISCTLPLALGGVPPLVDACRDHQIPTLAGGSGFGPDDLRSIRLGADGHAVDIGTAIDRLTEWLDRPPPPPPSGSVVVADVERASIAAERTSLVDASYRQLERQLPAMAGYDDRQQRHVRRDLDYILQYVDTTLLVDDQRIFADFMGWLGALLEARGVPAAVLDVSPETVLGALPRDLARARTVLERGLASLQDR